MSERLTFDAEEHKYTLDGRPVPSVTQILAPLSDFSHIAPDVLERARQFGTAVHEMINLYEQDDLDRAGLDPALERVLQQYERAFKAAGWTGVTHCEARVFNATLGYAGTLDLNVMLPGKKLALALVDVKTGSENDAAGPQTIAYQRAAESMLDLIEPIKRRYRLRLTETDYHLDRLDDPTDWSLFLSCLNIYQWRENHGYGSH